MVEIQICEVAKTFTEKQEQQNILSGINLNVEKGEIVAIRGDNGCGKTTLLNMIAGIEVPTQGQVNFYGTNSETLRIGYVQQDYTSSLLPWFDVLDNIAIPLRLSGVKRSEYRKRAIQLLEELGFDLKIKKYPHQLSGGQKQRVAVARALIHKPHILLLDEPFSNIDDRSSRELQETLLQRHESDNTTTIFISHELDHCIYLADRVILLRGSPSRVHSQFNIGLMRPRKREIILSSVFTDYRAQILAKEENLYTKE